MQSSLRGTILIAGLLAALAAGCATTDPIDRDTRMNRGYVYYLDGAGGGGALRNWAGGVRDGLRNADYPGTGEMFKWQTGLGVSADQTASVEYKRGKARELAGRIEQFTQARPGVPVTLIGLSAGTVIAVYALEELPERVAIDDLILLSGSLSADHDMTRALQRVKNKAYVFTSERDAVLLYLLPLEGTADRKIGAAPVGTRGLIMPSPASAETLRQYQKVVHVPWTPEFARLGNPGGHTDSVNARFVQAYIGPLIIRDQHAMLASAAPGVRQVPNPDYERWSAFAVGSYSVLDGYQALGGKRASLRARVTLTDRDGDRLRISRRFMTSPGGAVPAVAREYFADPLVDPDQTPLTHTGARVETLPDERVQTPAGAFDCTVRHIRTPGRFELWGENIDAKVWSNPTVPGGVVRLELRSTLNGQPAEFHGELVEFQVAPAAAR